MSIFSENKLLFGAVGIALSSVAVGYVVGRRHKKMFSNNWKTLSGSNDVVKQYLLDHGIREPESLRKLREATVHTASRQTMMCSSDESQLIRLLMQLLKAKKVIEIGVYTGYNTLSMATMLPPGGKVVACDITDKYLREINSQQYFEEAGVESKIDLRLQSAITTLDELIAAGESGSYDLVFIDADKTEYDQYYEKSLQLLRSGGIVVVDNALWDLKVCSPEMIASDMSTRVIHNLNLKIHKDSRVMICFLPLADGVNIVMKL
ncbi:Catechol O-methyltransferase domain-containing protein 1 [Porites harrisoni]